MPPKSILSSASPRKFSEIIRTTGPRKPRDGYFRPYAYKAMVTGTSRCRKSSC